VVRVAETGSTNADLLDAARAGAPHGAVLVADHQTAGRGRLGRTWEAPPGANLLVSILFRHDLDPPHRLTQRVALAAARACDAVAGVSVTLKWPNDLLLDGAKLAGILAQVSASRPGPPDAVVVGLGLNVGWAPEGAARLPRGTRDEVLAALLAELAAAPADLAGEYRRRLATLGQRVRVELAGGTTLEGTALDVEADGRLVVVDACAITHRVDTGDVVHLRPA
jgi:BirA family biotin operon repressor/biotin-[acetyl-CoA-carboxylase] ligase